MKFSDFLYEFDPVSDFFFAAHGLVFDDGDDTQHIERLGLESRMVYLLWSLDGEIHNGGFDQLFANPLGDHALELVDALETVGAEASRSLLSEALADFPGGAPSKDREIRWAQLEKLAATGAYSAKLNELDAKYCESADNLNELIQVYMRQHPHAPVAA